LYRIVTEFRSQWAIPNAFILTPDGGELEGLHGTSLRNWSVSPLTVTQYVQIGTTFDLDQIVEAYPCMEANNVV